MHQSKKRVWNHYLFQTAWYAITNYFQLKIKQLNSKVTCSIMVVEVLCYFLWKLLYLRVKIHNRQRTSNVLTLDRAWCTKQIMGIVAILCDKKTICRYKILLTPWYLCSWVVKYFAASLLPKMTCTCYHLFGIVLIDQKYFRMRLLKSEICRVIEYSVNSFQQVCRYLNLRYISEQT